MLNVKQCTMLVKMIQSAAENRLTVCKEIDFVDFREFEREVLNILAIPKIAAITTVTSRCCGFKKNGKRCTLKVAGSFCTKHTHQGMLLSEISSVAMKPTPAEESHLPKKVKNDDDDDGDEVANTITKCQHESYSDGYYQTGKLCGRTTTEGNKFCNEHLK